jgi:pyruvyltransferase
MKELNICYWGGNGNWGDELNKVLCQSISGKPVNKISVNCDDSTFRYYCVGSILQSAKSDNFEVWGTGFMRSNGSIKFKPNKVHAVRGPLTRDLLLKQNIDCPEIYGDPALLYPKFYKPKITKKYKFGLIPHYVDVNHPWVKSFIGNKYVKIINIKNFNINEFVDEVNECEIILSSSLHGIICGDSYSIPSYWVELSDKVIGNGFKFRDYFSSVGRPLNDPIRPNLTDKIMDISHHFYDYKINIDLNKLLEVCPFKK